MTITTLCDGYFFWGAFLLVASVRKHNVRARFNILIQGFDAEQRAALEQFGDVKLFDMLKGVRRNPCTRKSEALLTAETDYIAWMDSDCIVTGDVSEMLIPENGSFQIQLRTESDNAELYEGLYFDGEKAGRVPEHIDRQWQRDVADLSSPRLATTCVTNCFVIHQKHRPFIELWKRQIEKVLPESDFGVSSRSYPVAYFITDEAVLSSLLRYSSQAPEVSAFRLDGHPGPHVAHFVLKPKPWQRWLARNWRYYDDVMGILDWARSSGFKSPPLPWSLDRRYKRVAETLSAIEEVKFRVKRPVRNLLRRFHRSYATARTSA